MRRFTEGNQIGRGARKTVFESNEDPEKLVANFHDLKSNDQVKSTFYLGKIAHILFPDNIPDIHAAFNDEGGKGKLYLENAHPDEEHKQHAQYRVDRVEMGLRDETKVRLSNDYHDKNINDPEVIKLADEMERKGLWPDTNGLNFARSKDGKVLYLDSEPGYIDALNMRMFNFKPDILKKAIEELPEGSQKQQALNYFERLIKLTREEE